MIGDCLMVAFTLATSVLISRPRRVYGELSSTDIACAARRRVRRSLASEVPS